MGERNEGKDWEKKRIDQRRGKGEGRERGEKEEEERGTEEKIDLKERKRRTEEQKINDRI